MEYGADAGAKDYEGLTPVHWLLASNSSTDTREAVEHMLRQKNPIDLNTRSHFLTAPPLVLAASAGYTDAAIMMIERGADVNGRGGYQNNSALHLAARNGDKILVKALLSKGADVVTRNKISLTPAEEARKAGHTDLASFIENAPR